MKRMGAWLVVVVAGIPLAACGAGGVSTPTPTPTPAALPCPVPSPPPLETGSASSWEWITVGFPLGERELYTISVDPQDPSLWYVGGQHGLYVTRDAGRTWGRPLSGFMGTAPVKIASNDPCTVYAGVSTVPGGGSKLYRSTNRGLSWTIIHEAAESIASIHVGRRNASLILIGATLTPDRIPLPDAVYRSVDGGNTWSRQPYDGRSRGLIPWDIGEDVAGVLYVGTEIWDHPQPYRAPFFRSLDLGVTWEDVTGALPWHVIHIQSHPDKPLVYAQLEGPGIFVSDDSGTTWRQRGRDGFAGALLLDPSHPNRLYAGSRGSGAFASTNEGKNFHSIGLSGLTLVGSLALDGTGSTLFAACYKGGIYWARVPTSP